MSATQTTSASGQAGSQPVSRTCPHCRQKMSRWSHPQFTFQDGLGWDSEELYVCFNDQCPIYVKGWDAMYDNYGRIGSMRFWRSPKGNDEGVLPVGNEDAMKGDIIPEPEDA